MRSRARRRIRRRTRRSLVWAYRHTLRTSLRQRKLWLAVVIVRAMLLAPSAIATEETQRLSVGEVEIEGKLYSPQALFVVSRAQESFGRDAVIPHYLQLGSTSRLLPYRLRIELLERAAHEEDASTRDAASAASASDDGQAVSRRSP